MVQFAKVTPFGSSCRWNHLPWAAVRAVRAEFAPVAFGVRAAVVAGAVVGVPACGTHGTTQAAPCVTTQCVRLIKEKSIRCLEPLSIYTVLQISRRGRSLITGAGSRGAG